MMFCEPIRVTARRASATSTFTVPARCVDDGQPDDSVEGRLVAPVDRYTFFVRRREWFENATPHVGDVFERGDGVTFVATRVSTLGECYAVNCRSR